MPISRDDFMNIEQDMYVHKSWVQMYMQCPLKFRRQIIDKVHAEPSYEMKLGTEFHEYAKGFFRLVDLSEISHMNTSREVCGYFLTFTPSNISPPVYGWIQTFHQFEANRYIDLRKKSMDPAKFYKPVMVEETLRSEKFKLETTPDRVDLFDETSFILVEYKAAQSMHYADWRRELAIQSILVNEKFNNQCRYIAVFNPKINITWAEKLKDASVANAHRQIARLRRAVAMQEYPAKPTDRCVWCDYKSLCLDEGVFEIVSFGNESEEETSKEMDGEEAE